MTSVLDFEQSTIHALQKKFIEMKEVPFTQEVVIPFLKYVGFMQTEDHGGAYEEGKDIICWKSDEFNNLELVVAQVKLFKFKAASSSNSTLTEVMVQLQQCATQKVPYTDGNKYVPNRIYLINPYEIDTRALQTHFQSFKTIKEANNITILSGLKFAELIYQKTPALVKKILGDNHCIHHVLRKRYGNEDLLAALQHRKKIDISSFYTDLNFVLGGNKRELLSYDFKGSNGVVEITRNNITNFIIGTCNIGKHIECDVCDEKSKEILIKLKREENKSKEIHDKIDELKFRISYISSTINSQLSVIKSELKNIATYESKPVVIDCQNFIEDVESFLLDGLFDLEKGGRYWKRINNIVARLDEAHITSVEGFDELYLSVLESLNSIRSSASEQVVLKERAVEARIFVNVFWEDIAMEMNNNREQILTEISEVNSGNKSKLHSLLNTANKFSKAFKAIIETPQSESLFKPVKKIDDRHLLEVSIHDVFDAGQNVIVLGSAGSGKTTSLQIYAHTKMESKPVEDVYLFIPLARVMSYFNSSSKTPVLSFTECLEAYFKSEHTNVSSDYFLKVFREKRCVLLLDGIDEVIDKFAIILSLIKQLRKEYPTVQIITSSRFSNRLDGLDFLGIRLLPFTNRQREVFINSWFTDEEQDRSGAIHTHLAGNSELAQIVNTPLLTTILCVLAKHNVPMPINETELYDERLNLLLGHYDLHKNITRVESGYNELLYTARKAAFVLHNFKCRYLSEEELVKKISERTSKYSGKSISKALSELVDPCNIMMTMTEGGEIGFGHLRYQEHLAACDLINDHSHNILRLMQDAWWKDALVLFAQMSDDISYLALQINSRGTLGDVISTFYDMTNVRPASEQAKLYGIFADYVDEFDGRDFDSLLAEAKRDKDEESDIEIADDLLDFE